MTLILTTEQKQFALTSAGARGPRGQTGAASGPLGDSTVGANEITDDDAGQTAIVSKLGLASTAPNKGAALVGYGNRTVAQKLAYLAIDRREYATLQLAVTAAATSGRALYLGDEEFTQTTSVILPDADLCIFGPGSGALMITFTGSGGLFVGTDLSATTNIDIGGFTARAGSPNCGRPVNIEYTTSTGINVRAVRLFDIIADISPDAVNYWTGGPRLKNARNSVIEECYTQGAYDSLTKTIDGMQIAGEATDVKITNFQAISVGKGLDIIDQVEGTIITGFVAVDVNIGVSKVHVGAAEPWLSMTNWHISTRRTGIYMDNVLQATITPGLIYCQNGDGEFIGIHVDGGSIANQDMKISAIVDAQLGGAGMTDSTGIEIAQGNGIDVDLTTRAVSTCAYFGALAYDNIVRIMPSDYDVIATGTGLNQFNRIVANIPGSGWALPKVVGPYNPDATSAAGKTAEIIGFGTDSVGAIKGVGGMRVAAQNSNWTDSDMELYARIGDALTRVAIFADKAIIFDRLLALNFANDAAAAAGGVPVGGEYHNAGARRIRLS